MTNDNNYKVCSMCGSLIDTNNIININGNDICKSCIEKKLENSETISSLGTFICSFIPGLGHIYIGKKEKGKFLLFSFIVNIFISIFSFIIFDNVFSDILEFIFILLFCISIILNFTIYIYSLTNANFSRKYIENNKYINDFVDNISYKFIKSCKSPKKLSDKIIDKRLQ